MKRRSLLAGAAALALTPFLPKIAFGAVTHTRHPTRALRRVRPPDGAWPNEARWQELNQRVGGNLIKVQPLFHECAADADAPSCKDAIANVQNPFYIGDQPAGTEVSGWLDAWTPAPSVYAVRARNAIDVAAAVNFARDHNLRLAIKGGGHSYQGTSNAPDSLLIWTRGMNDIVLHDAFVPKGCDGETPVSAVTAGAGCVWVDLYNAVSTKAGRYVQGGGCTSVGVAGLIQSGGFGSFSKRYGMAAAGLLEAEIVTADGAVRTANACTNADLFWALKGGGGGTFGVITKVRLRTHELPQFFGGAGGKIKAASDEAFHRLIARFVDFYAETLFNPTWGEHVSFSPDNVLEISMVCQGIDTLAANATWKPFLDWLAKSPRDYTMPDAFGAGTGPAHFWWDAEARRRRGNHSLINDPRAGAPAHHAWWDGDQGQCSAYLYGYESAWLPASLLQPDHRARLSDALFAASRHEGVELHFNKGLAGAPPEAVAAARNTATNPAVCDAFALAIIADGRAPYYPLPGLAPLDEAAGRKVAGEIHAATEELRKIAPNPGSYVSESNYFEPDWQHSYFGTNYARLREVKAKYDRDGLFFVHNGVGSEEWSHDGFERVR